MTWGRECSALFLYFCSGPTSERPPMGITPQPSTQTCCCTDIVTVTPVERSCQSIKAPFRRRLHAAPLSPHLAFFIPDVVLLPRHFFSSFWCAGSRLKSSSLLAKFRIKARPEGDAGSTCLQYHRGSRNLESILQRAAMLAPFKRSSGS